MCAAEGVQIVYIHTDGMDPEHITFVFTAYCMARIVTEMNPHCNPTDTARLIGILSLM